MAYHNKTSSKQEQRQRVDSSNALVLKLTDVKKIIRNKFKIAHANRLECERNASHAMKPSTASKSSIQQHACAKIESSDMNYLCTRLKLLLSSTKMDDVQRTLEINAIINRLRDLEIIV